MKKLIFVAITLLNLNTKIIASEISGFAVITDGDTIKISNNRIRLYGIDAPERNQPFGNVSRKQLESMVAGKQVLVRAIKLDRYGRVLGNVWVQPRDCPRCGKTLYVNHAQILAGMAWWYEYYAEDQSAGDRGRFASAQQEARARKWGLWADPDPCISGWGRNARGVSYTFGHDVVDEVRAPASITPPLPPY